MSRRQRPAPDRTWVARSPRQRQGALAEETAARWLEQNGLRIVERNVAFRVGEIDIVAWDGDTLVFVEVRARIRTDDAAYSLDRAKRGKMLRAAALYLMRRFGARVPPCRFDAVLCGAPGIRWLQNIDPP